MKCLVTQKIARLKTVAKGKNFLTRIWKSISVVVVVVIVVVVVVVVVVVDPRNLTLKFG